MSEVRTRKGKMVGTLDMKRMSLNIRTGKRMTLIKIPDEGLRIQVIPMSGDVEDVYIPPITRKEATSM